MKGLTEMSDNLRDRIAAVLDESLHRQKGIDRPDRFKDWIDNRELADAVLEMLTVHIPPSVASAIHGDKGQFRDETT